jgi:hypothetical protein
MTQPDATPGGPSQERQSTGAGGPPPGASEPSPEQPRIPPRQDPEPSDPVAQGGTKEMPEGQYGKAGIVEKPRG